jgi:hypothetical protein
MLLTNSHKAKGGVREECEKKVVHRWNVILFYSSWLGLSAPSKKDVLRKQR